MLSFYYGVNRTLLSRFVVLLSLFSIMAFTGISAQEDVRDFQIYTRDLVNRVTFSYSTRIDEDAVWNFVPASRDFRTPTGPIPEYWQVIFQNYSADLGWVPSGKSIYVYPTVTFPAGADYPFTHELANLKAVLSARPAVPAAPLPMLPTVTATQLFRAQVRYLDFSNGSGIRFITAAGLDQSPLSNPVVFYTFQGLTNDGAYYIAAQFPLHISLLPDEAPPMTTEQYEAFVADYDRYIGDLTKQLDDLESTAFEPELTVIDNLFQSLEVHGPAATILTAENSEMTTVAYENLTFSFDSRLASRIEVDVIPPLVDTNHMTMFGSEPAYTVFSLFDFPVLAPNTLAQFRLIPVATFPSSDTISDQHLSALKDFLANRPPLAAQTSASGAQPFPILPPINAAQLIAAQPVYLDFQNGGGVRFISAYSQGIEPITNPLFYQFTGMTADGQYVVSAQFLVTASILPEVDYTTLDYDAFAVGYSQYVQETLTALDDMDAAAYLPDLALLDDLIRSISIGG